MGKRLLLLVENHDHLRQMLGGFLSQHFEVVGARDGLEALSWLNSGLSPDAIVTGAQLPKISGPQFVEALRNSGLHRDIPVVVIGEQPSKQGEEQQFRQLGVDDYLGKPFDPLRLFDRLTALTTAPGKSALA